MASSKQIVARVIVTLLIIAEVGIIVNSYLTVKYRVEMIDDRSHLLDIIYSLVGALSTVIAIDISVIIVLLTHETRRK